MTAPSNKTAKKAPKKSTSKTPKDKKNQPPQELRVTPVSAWEDEFDDLLLLPSSKVVRIRNMGFQTFMKMGLVPNSLMGVVQSALSKGEEPDADDLLGDSTKLNDMLKMVDGVVCHVVVEPPVEEPPANKADRDPNILYLDKMADDDKMFIFGVCTGGTRDVEAFRSESNKLVASLQ